MSRINQRLNGLNPLAYIGVEAPQPTDFITQPRDPTSNDSKNFYLGTWWLNTSSQDLWYLASLSGLVATWILVSGSSGAVISLTGDVGVAVPTAGNINVFGSHGINTAGAASTLTVAINNAITLGDLSVIAPASAALTAASGSIFLSASTAAAATNPKIIFGGSNNLISFLFNNVFIGMSAGNNTMTAGQAIFNIGIGPSACASLTTGGQNVGIGNGVLQSCTTGANNNGVGYVALNKVTTGTVNNAFGIGALGNCTTGNQNNAFGNSLNNLTTGSKNTSIGYFSGDGVTTGSFNTFVGNSAGVSAANAGNSNVYINHQGVGGAESNTLRIGETAGDLLINKAFIAGIRGVTTGVNDAVPVLIDSAGQLGVTSSSIRTKENVNDMGSYSDDLMSLRPVTFNYKVHSPESKSVGLIAEEVSDVAPHLVVYDREGNPETVKYQDLVPMLLNEIQKLSKRVEVLEKGV